MNLPNRLTLFRIILAPLFFIVYFLPWLANKAVWAVPLLWIIFLVSEVTDMLDGMVARRLNQTSDFGKLFDPFADTLMQISCFLCFVLDNIIPAALFLVVLYREFGILLLRNYMLQKGITMGARISGKIKTVAYIAAAGTALLCTSLRRLVAAGPSAAAAELSATAAGSSAVAAGSFAIADGPFATAAEPFAIADGPFAIAAGSSAATAEPFAIAAEPLATLNALLPVLETAAIAVFAVSVLFSVLSFIDYVLVCRASVKTGE